MIFRKQMVVAALAVFFSVFSTSRAQEYVVYQVTGKVMKVAGGSSAALALREKLPASTRLQIPTNGRVKLFDRQNKTLVTLQGGEGSISALVKNQPSSVKDLSPNEQYFKYIVKSIEGRETLETKICETENTTTTFRETDTILITRTDTLIIEH